MSSYAFWNNKGGVGKSYLVFIAACEYSHSNPDTDVYVIDLCPQGNVSETLLGGAEVGGKNIERLIRGKTRKTVSGYLDARLNSPFVPLGDPEPYVSHPSSYSSHIPENLYLVCGDNLLEIQSDAIRQTSQLAVPASAWAQVISWIRDLVLALRKRSNRRDAVFFIDCNPSFAVYTQMGIAAAENLVVPFTADDSSRRGIENILALLFGIGDHLVETYSKLSFSSRAKSEGIQLPRLHTFVSNRVTLYKGEPSSAFRAVSSSIEKLMDETHKKHRAIFIKGKAKPSRGFVSVPDYHSACVVSSTLGKPLHMLRAGPVKLGQEVVQLNKSTLEPYREALENFVDRL